jgi:hypothetical protein
VRPTSSRVDHQVDTLIKHWLLSLGIIEHILDILRPERLLQRVKCHTRELRLDQIRPVLHDRLQPNVTLGALPARDQMKQMDAFTRLPVLYTLFAGEFDAQRGEDRHPSRFVAHFDKSRIEVDF